MEKKQKVKNNESVELQREWTKVVAQAWADPDFRKRLEKNPRAVLKERGVNIPGDIDLEVIDKPVAIDEIERAVRPMAMAVAAGFAAAPSPTLAYADPAMAGYYGAVDPTLEGKWKVGLCLNVKATGGACAYFHWGAGQPFPAQPFPAQPPFPQQALPQQPIPQQPAPQVPAASYGPQQPQQPPTAAYAGGAEAQPYYYADDPYAAGALDPTLEGKWKVGLCVNVRATAGACAYFHWGAAQPFPAQQPFPQQAIPQQPIPQQPAPQVPAASYGPQQPQQPQQPPTAAYAGGAEAQPYYYADNPYAAGAIDPTLEGKWKVGLCVNVKATAGACAYFHWGAAQPFPAQQPPFPTQQPLMQQPPMQPAPPYAAPQQPQQQPQQPTSGWAATVPTQCFSGAAAPSQFVPPGYGQYHILPYPGRQTRPATPGSA